MLYCSTQTLEAIVVHRSCTALLLSVVLLSLTIRINKSISNNIENNGETITNTELNMERGGNANEQNNSEASTENRTQQRRCAHLGLDDDDPFGHLSAEAIGELSVPRAAE